MARKRRLESKKAQRVSRPSFVKPRPGWRVDAEPRVLVDGGRVELRKSRSRVIDGRDWPLYPSRGSVKAFSTTARLPFLSGETGPRPHRLAPRPRRLYAP